VRQTLTSRRAWGLAALAGLSALGSYALLNAPKDHGGSRDRPALTLSAGRSSSFRTGAGLSPGPAPAAAAVHWRGGRIDGVVYRHAVERTSRFTMLLHLPPMSGLESPRAKNGLPVTGAGAQAVRDAIAAQFGDLPAHLRRSLTWDQGAELAQHAKLKIDTGLQVYFCDRQSPWERGTNENTNGLLRQYFPKGTDLTS
jgi:hypothetical protein